MPPQDPASLWKPVTDQGSSAWTPVVDSAPPQQIDTPGQMVTASGRMLGNLFGGIGGETLKTASNIGRLAFPDAAARALHMQVPTPEYESHLFGEDRPQERTGRAAGSVLQFLAPGEAEDAAVSRAPEFLKPLARVGTAALSSGAVNKAQGGDFGTGAAAGGTIGALGEGARAIAPGIVRSALGIGREGAEYGRNSGKAVLNETRSVRLPSLVDEMNDRLGELDREFDSRATGELARMAPIRAANMGRMRAAEFRNSPNEQRLIQKLHDPLMTEYRGGKPMMQPIMQTVQEPTGVLDASGNPITRDVQREVGKRPIPVPNAIPAKRLRAIKQGVGQEVSNFSPQNQKMGATLRKQIYGDINQELHRVVPGGAELDERMSNLIPARDAAQRKLTSPGVAERAAGRMAARTGALTAAAVGGAEGAKIAGLPGAIAGGGLSLLAPDLLTAPTAQMVLARGLYSPASARIGRSIMTPITQRVVDAIRARGQKGRAQ